MTAPSTKPNQRDELCRVKGNIGELIMRFCSQNWTFRMEDLRGYVERKAGGMVAPDSPGRVLRKLRKKRKLNYEVVSRSGSLYRVKPANGQGDLFRRVG